MICRLAEVRMKVNTGHRYTVSLCKPGYFARLTEEDSRSMDPVPFVPAAKAKWPKHPPAGLKRLFSKVGRFEATDCNSPNPPSTSADIARRYVARPSPRLLWTIPVMPSNQVRTRTRKLPRELKQTFASLKETSNLYRPSTLDSIVRRAARPVMVPCS